MQIIRIIDSVRNTEATEEYRKIQKDLQMGKYSRILVTGGAGFIGSNFVRYLVHNHPEVSVTVLDALTYAGNIHNLDGLIAQTTSGSEEESGQAQPRHVQGAGAPAAARPSVPVTFMHGSICDDSLVDSVVSQADAIVHFAAESHNDNAIYDPDPVMKTNIMGTFTMLQAARRYGVRFHHVSTDEVFGDLPLDSQEEFTEDSPYRPSSPYAASKAASDHLVRSWVRTYGLQATISTCSNNYGPYQHVEKFIPRQITNILQGKPIKIYGDGLAVRDWIAVEDQCSAVWKILEAGTIGETYVISSRGERSNIQIAHDIMSLMGAPADSIEFVPDRPGADRRYALNASKIRADLGWEPEYTDFYQGLRRTITWYRDHRSWWLAAKEAAESRYCLQAERRDKYGL